MLEILKNPLYFGIDEFEIYINKEDINFFKDLVYSLDEDNSTIGYITLSGREFVYNKYFPKGYDYGYKFFSNFDFIGEDLKIIQKPIDCFALNFGIENLNKNQKNVLVFYSSLLYMHENNHFDVLDFINKNFSLQKNFVYRRLDFCIDVNVGKKDIIKYFKTFKSLIHYEPKNGYYQTYYTRAIQTSQNNDFIFRIYDKIKDSIKKHKTFMYSHLNNEFVTRIECEIRPDKAVNIKNSLQEILFDNNIKFHLFLSFLLLDIKEEFISDIYQYFNVYKFVGTPKTKKIDLRNSFLTLGFLPSNYLSYANGYIKNIHENSGYFGLIQLFLGVDFEDKNKNVILPNGIKKYKLLRDPFKILLYLVNFMRDKLNINQKMINDFAYENIIKTPILKLKK